MDLSIVLSSNRYETVASNDLEKLESIFSKQLPQGSFLVEVEFISEEKMRQINLRHRNINHSTDVLSFPLFDLVNTSYSLSPQIQYLLGNIFISPATAKKYKETVLDLIHHGMLHLMGYDHETNLPDWLTKEREMLKIYNIEKLQISGIVNE